MKVSVGKIKPCPFCGGHPKLIELNKGFAGFTGNVYDYSVKCGACRATTATYHTIDDARRAWNRRAGKEEGHGQIEGLSGKEQDKIQNKLIKEWNRQ